MVSSVLNTPLTTPSTDRLTLWPRTPASSSSRRRADSAASYKSVPGVPTNTRAPSVAGDHVAPPLAIAPVDLDKVNENLEMPADVLHGEPTFVPSNTPAGTIVGSPRSHYGPLKQGLSQIPEGIEQLPPSHCGSYLSEGARSVTSEPAGHYDFAHEGEITIGMPITPTANIHPQNAPSTESEGVLEHHNWGEEAEELLYKGFKRLDQLADDEHKQDPSMSAQEYYSLHLSRMLNDPTRRFAYNANKARPGIARAVSTSVEVGSPPPKAKETTSVTSHQFRMLEHDVEKSAIDTEKLQYSFEQMRKEMDALILELKSEVSRREDLQRKLDERALTPSAPESSAN